MNLNLLGVRDGCNAAAVINETTTNVTEATDSRAEYTTQCIGRAVCGGRIVQVESEYNFANKFSSGSQIDRAHTSVQQDLSTLVGAMCLGCPNFITGNNQTENI